MVLRGKVRKWDQFFYSKWPVVKKVSGMEENGRGDGLKTEKCQEKQTQPKTKPNLAKNKKKQEFVRGELTERTQIEDTTFFWTK